VYVKEGSFIPMADFSSLKKINNTNDYTDRKLIIEYFPSMQKTSYSLFLDDGITSQTLENKKYALINLEGRAGNHVIKININVSGDNAIKNIPRSIKLIVPAAIESATINNKTIPVDQNFLFPDLPFSFRSQYLQIQFSGKPLFITLHTK
jgi:hypothetical protein